TTISEQNMGPKRLASLESVRRLRISSLTTNLRLSRTGSLHTRTQRLIPLIFDASLQRSKSPRKKELRRRTKRFTEDAYPILATRQRIVSSSVTIQILM